MPAAPVAVLFLIVREELRGSRESTPALPAAVAGFAVTAIRALVRVGSPVPLRIRSPRTVLPLFVPLYDAVVWNR